MEIYAQLAHRLREVRQHPLNDAGAPLPALSQKELGRRIGVSRSGVGQYEVPGDDPRGRKPPLHAVQHWAQACGYRLLIELVPPSSPKALLTRVCAARPEVQRLLELLLQVASTQPEPVLDAMEAALHGLTIGSKSSLSRSDVDSPPFQEHRQK